MSKKLRVVSGQIENAINGSKKRNSEIVISGKNNRKNIPIAIRM